MHSSAPTRSATRLGVALAVVLGVAGLHLVNLRARLPEQFRILYQSYFSDLAIPFAFYFLLCLIDDRTPSVRSPYIKALVVFLASTTAEVLQGAGVPLLGRTFDWLDIAAYAIGVTLALGLDILILSRALRSWPLSPS